MCPLPHTRPRRLRAAADRVGWHDERGTGLSGARPRLSAAQGGWLGLALLVGPLLGLSLHGFHDPGKVGVSIAVVTAVFLPAAAMLMLSAARPMRAMLLPEAAPWPSQA